MTKMLQQLTVMSQEEVGRAMGLTAMRVSQLERSAFKKLRAAFKEQGYELREPAKPFPHGTLRLLAKQEREEWMWRLLLADCDLNESPVARNWRAQ